MLNPTRWAGAIVYSVLIVVSHPQLAHFWAVHIVHNSIDPLNPVFHFENTQPCHLAVAAELFIIPEPGCRRWLLGH